MNIYVFHIQLDAKKEKSITVYDIFFMVAFCMWGAWSARNPSSRLTCFLFFVYITEAKVALIYIVNKIGSFLQDLVEKKNIKYNAHRERKN